MSKQYIKHPIRMIRIMSEKTQDDIFRETGIQPSKYSRIERGVVPPTDKELRLLVKAFDLPPGSLFLEDLEA